MSHSMWNTSSQYQEQMCQTGPSLTRIGHITGIPQNWPSMNGIASEKLLTFVRRNTDYSKHL